MSFTYEQLKTAIQDFAENTETSFENWQLELDELIQDYKNPYPYLDDDMKDYPELYEAEMTPEQALRYAVNLIDF